MSADPPTLPSEIVCLVVMREIVIAQDIAAIVQDADPAARVVIEASEDRALEAIETVGRLKAAFIHARPRDFEGSLLHKAIVARGCRPVLLGGEAERGGAGTGWGVLVVPFTARNVRSLIEAGD